MRLKLAFVLVVFCQSFSWAQDDFWLSAIHVDVDQDEAYFPAVAECGFNVVQLTRYANQEYWDQAGLVDTNQIHFFEKQLKEIRASQMQAVFIPRVHLVDNNHNKYLWHGMILPEGEAAIKKWFENYWEFIAPYLLLSETYQVPMVAIGSELNALVEVEEIKAIPELYAYFLSKKKQWYSEGAILKFKDKIDASRRTEDGLLLRDELQNLLSRKIDQQYNWAKNVAFSENDKPIIKINQRRNILKREWAKLIAKVKTVYSGRLTYAANFDSYKEVTFWDELDFIGINAYFPLTKYKPKCKYNCKLKQTSKSWDKHLWDIKRFMSNKGLDNKQVVFTEIGYSRLQGSTFKPWKADGFSINPGYIWDDFIDWDKQEENAEERLAAIRSLHAAVRATNFPLMGLMYWELSNDVDKLATDPFGVKPEKEQPLIDALNLFKR